MGCEQTGDLLCGVFFSHFLLLFSLPSYPKRLRDLRRVFPHSDGQLSRIFNATIAYLDDKSIPYLEDFGKAPFDPAEMAAAIGDLCPLKNCLGFLDGTLRRICRPKYNQESVYNGNKRKHSLKYQGVVLGNGILKLYAVWPGRRHDSFMLGGGLAFRTSCSKFREIPQAIGTACMVTLHTPIQTPSKFLLKTVTLPLIKSYSMIRWPKCAKR